MSDKVNNSYYMKCPKCGSEYINAKAEAKVELRLWVYNNKVCAEIDNTDCDEDDLFDISCEHCGYDFAGTFFELQNEVKKSGDTYAK